MHDLAAAEAQYHYRCYDSFRKIPPSDSEKSILIDDEAMKNLVDEMYPLCPNQLGYLDMDRLRTWTSIELHEKYTSYGGKLTRKQMFSKLAMHLGEDVVVLNIDGCASVIGFHEFIGKVMKVAKVDNEDEDPEDALAIKIVVESRNIPFNRAKYELSNFTHAKIKEQNQCYIA